jgi:hypothetical protein
MPTRSHPQNFGTPVQITSAEPIAVERIREAIQAAKVAGSEGVTIEIVRPGERNGYLFHVIDDSGRFVLQSFKGLSITAFNDIASLTRFVNHASGLKFDPHAWTLSKEINREKVMENQEDESLALEE